MKIKIRKAMNSDAEQIQSLIFNIWQNEYQFDVKLEDYPDLIEINKYYAPPKGLLLVAADCGKIVGTIAYQMLGNNNFVLKRMFVAAKHRQAGIAQKLLSALFTYLQQNIKQYPVHIFLSTKEDQALAAKAFYLKNGFEIINKKNVPTGFPYFYEDDLFMSKSLYIEDK